MSDLIQVQEQKKTHIIRHDRPNCIGCAACTAVAPTFWEMNQDGKSDIIGGKNVEDEWQEKDIGEKEFPINLDAAMACPVNVIHIIKKDTGEKVI